MIRVGVDVGGTNTDAVVMEGEKFLGGAKSPTTSDILTGVENAIKSALREANTTSDNVDVLIIGTTHFLTIYTPTKDGIAKNSPTLKSINFLT